MRRVRAVAVAAVVTAATAAGCVAGAWYAAPASGTVTATASGMQPVTVAALAGGDAPSSDLVPGGTADVVLRIENPNPFAVVLTAASSLGPATASGGVGDCTVTGVTFVDQTGLDLRVPADSDTLLDLPGAAAMDASSESGCQGATFSLPVAVTVHST